MAKTRQVNKLIEWHILKDFRNFIVTNILVLTLKLFDKPYNLNFPI